MTVDECQALCGDVYSLSEDYDMITVIKSRSNYAPPVTDAIKVVLRIQRYKQSMRAARVQFFISHARPLRASSCTLKLGEK